MSCTEEELYTRKLKSASLNEDVMTLFDNLLQYYHISSCKLSWAKLFKTGLDNPGLERDLN